MTYEEFKKEIVKIPKTSKWLVYGTKLTDAHGLRQGFFIKGAEFPELFAKVDPTSEWEFCCEKQAIKRILGEKLSVTEASRVD